MTLMNQTLPFGSLPPYRPRRFVPAETNFGEWVEVAPLYDELEKRLGNCQTSTALEEWLRLWSELVSALDEEGARRYIAMTCHTDDARAESAYLHFVEHIEPEAKPRHFKIAHLFVQHPVRPKLPVERYRIFNRDIQVLVDLFRPDNVPLETEEAKLGQQYQKITGGMTVKFQNEEQTVVQLSRYLEEPDRELRQRAWEAQVFRRLEEAERFEEIFDNLVGLRHQIALNAGFQNYRDYAFRKLGRFDYTPQDCEDFHSAVGSEVMPLVRRLQEQRRQHLKVGTLRPWDLAVDPQNRPPLRPFSQVGQLVDGCERVFTRLDAELADGFRLMRTKQLLDLENRKGKGPGGYQWTLAEARLPFIFMNAVGLQRDVETLLHEGGHAFHALATQDEDLQPYRNPPIEFCEVASMSMELLGNDFLEEFYPEAKANRARENHLESILKVLPWIATVDAFQHWVYTHPHHTPEERAQAWTNVMDRFEGDVEWTGYERVRRLLWHKQLHIFLNAFYYIEYGIAQMGALRVWANYREDKASAAQSYKKALKLGNTVSLPELFAAAGCPFSFGRETLRPLIQLIQAELENLASERKEALV